MFAFPGKKGNCEFNFCVCTWLYVVCKWLAHLLRSFKCDCGKNLAIRNYLTLAFKKRPTVIDCTLFYSLVLFRVFFFVFILFIVIPSN